MKKAFKYYLCVWVILLVLFNILAFIPGGFDIEREYSASFWIGYLFITFSFVGQLICAYSALSDDNITKTFYNISLLRASYTGLILSFGFGGVCMLFSFIPYWISVILCAIVLAFNITGIVKAVFVIEAVSAVDEKIKNQAFFIRALMSEADALCSRATSEKVKAECKKVYEAVRYSDPMSSDVLAITEEKILAVFSELVNAVESDNVDETVSLSEKLLVLIKDRNNRCRLLK